MQETQVWSLGQDDPLEKEMATHSSILAWRIPWIWWATVHGAAKSQTTERLTHPKINILILILNLSYVRCCACVLSRFSCVQLVATPWNVAQKAPLSMGFSRQEYSSGLLCPLPGELPNPCITCVSCIGRWILYYCTIWEALIRCYPGTNCWKSSQDPYTLFLQLPVSLIILKEK